MQSVRPLILVYCDTTCMIREKKRKYLLSFLLFAKNDTAGLNRCSLTAFCNCWETGASQKPQIRAWLRMTFRTFVLTGQTHVGGKEILWEGVRFLSALVIDK